MQYGDNVTSADGSWNRSYQVYKVMKTKVALWLGSRYQNYFLVGKSKLVIASDKLPKHQDLSAQYYRQYIPFPASPIVATKTQAATNINPRLEWMSAPAIPRCIFTPYP